MKTRVAATRVLLVEDNPGDARLIRTLLAEVNHGGFDLTDAARLGDALERLTQNDFDVVLLDLSLPDSQGLDTVDEVRSVAPHTPIVVLSGLDDEEFAMQALQCGAQDYLIKGRNDGEVVARSVRYAIERERVERSLRRSEERYRLLVESVKDYAIFALDPEGRVTSWNTGAERLKGYREDEVLGEHFSRFYTGEDVAAGKPEKELRAARTEDRYEDNGWRTRKDGSRFWANILISALRDGSGRLRGFSKVTRDLTESKKAEEALRESEERFRSLVQHASDITTILEADGSIRYESPALERILGYRPEELLGTNAFRYIHPEDLDRVLRAFTRGLEGFTDDPYIEYRFRHADGSWRYLESIGTILLDDPAVKGIVVNSRDITERKKAEEALKESEERYRAVIEQSAEGIYLLDSKTKRVTETNPALCSMLGYSAEELRGADIYDLIAHTREDVDLNLRRTLEEKSRFVGERCYRRKDGTFVDVEVGASMVSYSGSDLLCVIVRDITERKNTVEKLRGALDALLALYEAGRVLGSTLEPQEIGARLLDILRRVSGIETAIISLRDNQEHLYTLSSVGLDLLPNHPADMPEVRAARHAALKTKVHQLFRLGLPSSGGTLPVGLCLPFLSGERAIGVLEVYGPETIAKKASLELLGGLTSQAAGALANARLYKEQAEHERRSSELVGKLLSAQEEERRRVAYEIHDGLAQVAIAAHQHLQSFAEDHPPGTLIENGELDRALDLARRTVGDARSVIAGLRPTTLDDFGLTAAIRQEIESLDERGLEVVCEENLGEERLQPEIETALYRVFQEALTNARKHARATNVSVLLDKKAGRARLEVSDNGRGFDPAEVPEANGPGERVGLASMEERITLLGGELLITSQPGKGTTVMAAAPLPGASNRRRVSDR